MLVPLLPSTVVPIRRVTPGFVRAVWPGTDALSQPVGYLAPRVLSEQLGLVPSTNLRLARLDGQQRVVRIVATLPTSARDEDSGRSLLEVVRPVGGVRACIVDARAEAARLTQARLTTWFPAAADVVVRPLWRPDDASETAEGLLAARTARWLPWAAGAMLAILALLVVHSRRVEFRLYQLLGARRGVLLGILACELVLMFLVPLQYGVLVGWAAVRLGRSEQQLQVLLSTDLKLLAMLMTVPVAVAPLTGAQRVVSALKGE